MIERNSKPGDSKFLRANKRTRTNGCKLKRQLKSLLSDEKMGMYLSLNEAEAKQVKHKANDMTKIRGRRIHKQCE